MAALLMEGQIIGPQDDVPNECVTAYRVVHIGGDDCLELIIQDGYNSKEVFRSNVYRLNLRLTSALNVRPWKMDVM